MKFILTPFKLLWSFLVIVTPLLGVWLASSLASYFDGPIWAAVLSGSILFPAGPFLWEWWSGRRFDRKQTKRKEAGKKERKRWLTFWDRLIVRTLVVNLVFIALLLGLFPKEAFSALTSRGDWMLQSREDSTSQFLRRAMFGAAGGLEWLHNVARENPYKKYAPDDQPDEKPKPNPIPIPTPIPSPEPKPDPSPTVDPTPDPIPDPTPAPREAGAAPSWPMAATLHPAVVSIPADQERSIESVAKYIKSREDDPFLRVKALNDYVADRVAYDAPALAAGNYPPQDAETVFKTKKAVCAGYAKLMIELAKHTGDKIVYVVGVSRDQGGAISGAGHAWNAAEIEGRWYLLDTTWNAGYVEGATFHKKYATDHLFTPPEAFGVDHFPDKEEWQLRADPISRGDFVRQPMLRAGFYANGLQLVTPNRSQVSVSGENFVITLKNPYRRKLMAQVMPKNGRKIAQCDVDEGVDASFTCPLGDSGRYTVKMFATDRGRTYPFVGQLEALH